MSWFIVAHCFSLLLELVRLRHQSDRAKDSVLPLRQATEIVQRKLDQPLHVSRAEKFTLALLTIHLIRSTGQSVKELSHVIRLFQPQPY
jgi:hypothetical protein